MVIGELSFVLFLLVLFFLLISGFNILFRKEICSVCSAVFLTWLTLLILFYVNLFNNQLILGILMGGTVAGLFNLLKSKLGVFKFPFAITLFFVIYFLLTFTFQSLVIYLLILLWFIFFLIFVLQKKKFSSLVEKLIRCCRNW